MYHEGKAFVIDVSQSVEHDHPNALEFLRKDLTNVNEFFRKKKINVLTVKELFDFVVDPRIERGHGEEEALVQIFHFKITKIQFQNKIFILLPLYLKSIKDNVTTKIYHDHRKYHKINYKISSKLKIKILNFIFFCRKL